MMPNQIAAIDAPDAAQAESLDPVAIRMPLDVRSVALTILAVLAVIFFLQRAQALVIPLVLGLLISYALDPIVTRLALLKIPRPAAAAVVLFTLIGTGSALIYQLRFQAAAIVSELPEAAQRLRLALERDGPGSTSAIKKVQEAANELDKAADAATSTPAALSGVARVQVEDPPISVGEYVMWGSFGVVTGLIQLMMILFLTFFLLASGDLYRRKIIRIAGPSLTRKKITLQILQNIDMQIERFLLVQVATSTIVGTATWLAFHLIGLEQAGVWGLLAGIFNSIPYFGPVIVTGCTAVVAFLQFGTISMAAWGAFLAFAITSLEGFLLTPWLTSRAASMNAVAVFVGLLFWGWVWDVWGLLLAVPMLMVLKAVCDHVEDFKGVAELLGD